MIRVDDHPVPALMALDRERAHAVLPHVGEVHRLYRIVEPRTGCHSTRHPVRSFSVIAGATLFRQSVHRLGLWLA